MRSSHKRHDFPESVKRSLREHVNGFCSNPDCRELTISTKADSKSLLNIGIAAHICAASPGGPRYDNEQSEESRKSYDNGIWLCTKCATLIDRDEHRYPVKTLISWKESAHAFIRDNIGKELIPKEDIDSRVMRNTLEFISGNSRLLNASKAIKFIDDQLNALDPRFSVQTSIVDGKELREISAKTNDASFGLSMPFHEGQNFQKQLDKMRSTGEPVTLDSTSFNFTGSKLFETIGNNLSEGSQLSIEPASTRVKVDLYAVSKSQQVYLGTFKGKYITLKDGLKFTALAFNRLLEITAFYNINTSSMTFNYNFDSTVWYGKDIQKLPFFNKLLWAKDVLHDGGVLSVAIEFEEGYTTDVFYSSQCINENQLKLFSNIASLLHVIECYRKITKKYSLSTPIFGEIEVTPKQYEAIDFISSLLEGEEVVLGKDVATLDFDVPSEEYREATSNKCDSDLDELSFTHENVIPNFFNSDFSFLALKRTFIDMYIEASPNGDKTALHITPTESSRSVTSLEVIRDMSN
ncbi:hypothetical protein [Vibrio barjaei]|uniref:hypothetical protein n=1 Tax=Vibrio barjaei TaxID=1676683 RepID=UPI0007BBD15B|nr:hypothetical protein [Vibrio barjaei]OIN27394.1 hypothetical protein AWH66_2011880 [Vibrio barjaei]